nr:DNA polymerase Y family protein [Aureimonas fodinaquatilis]
MNAVSKPASRILALLFPYLPTDRIRRACLGRLWRVNLPASGDGPKPVLQAGETDTMAGLFREGPGSAHHVPRSAALTAQPASPSTGLQPLVLYEKDANAFCITACCEAAMANGVRPGLTMAETRARFPFFAFEPAEPAADARLLEAIADWCDGYTPLVALDKPNGLLLDISGCAHLFGGEAALLDDLVRKLVAQGFKPQAAIASQAGPALALAAYRPGFIVPETAAVEPILAPLPARALRFGAQTTAVLSRLGLKQVGDLLALPRAGLGRRFGADFMDRLDIGLGRAERPLNPRRLVPQLIHERRLCEPIGRMEDIEGLTLHLAQMLKPDLERRGQGARHLELALFRVDGVVDRVELRTAMPLRDPERIRRLFAERLKAIGDERDAGFGYDLLRLSVLSSAAMSDQQQNFTAGVDDNSEALEILIDRLAARLGVESVQSLQPVASHWPEKAQRLQAGLATASVQLAHVPDYAPRPLRLLTPPEKIEAMAVLPEGEPIRFVWRRATHRVVRMEGPERIAPEWWQQAVPDMPAMPARDYFRIEDSEGRRYWMFRLGDYETQEPQWFLHGIFA